MEEMKVLLRNVDKINPKDAYDYAKAGGFEGLKKALSMSREEIIKVLEDSGLRGRGGAGFPTYRKLQFANSTENDTKYIVCNADEGEPGTNKDRILLSKDPCAIIEGMAIMGKAIGAHTGFIYMRGEYTYLREVLYAAIDSCKENGYLGENIMGSDFSFDVKLRMGAGAYVCGEETAMFESIEGKRGEPRYRPPFPGIKGLFGKPTVLNNVETIANVAPILDKGADWYRSMGTEGSPGTKLFSIIGNVNKRGVYEFPMGINLKELIYDYCGGIADGRGLLAVQAGGASAPFINKDQIDIPLEIDYVASSGGRLGCGTIMVIDDTNCIVDMIQNNLYFFKEESCGKCTPCREGTTRLYELVTKISSGRGKMSDLAKIRGLGETMANTAFCGLGRSATVPVESALQNFADDFEKHIDKDFCPVCDREGRVL